MVTRQSQSTRLKLSWKLDWKHCFYSVPTRSYSQTSSLNSLSDVRVKQSQHTFQHQQVAHTTARSLSSTRNHWSFFFSFLTFTTPPSATTFEYSRYKSKSLPDTLGIRNIAGCTLRNKRKEKHTWDLSVENNAHEPEFRPEWMKVCERVNETWTTHNSPFCGMILSKCMEKFPFLPFVAERIFVQKLGHDYPPALPVHLSRVFSSVRSSVNEYPQAPSGASI